MVQSFVDAIIPAWLIVCVILYLNCTYLIRFWMNNTPFRWRYIGLIFGWTPTLLFYFIVYAWGVSVAFEWRWLARFGVFSLMLNSVIHNENTWTRLYTCCIGKHRTELDM